MLHEGHESDAEDQGPTKRLAQPFLDATRARPEEVWARRASNPPDVAALLRTRGESARIVERTTAQISDLGLGPGLLVGLLAASGPAFVEALIAAWAADLCPVLLDPSTTESERAELEARVGIGWRWDLTDGWATDLGRPRPGAADWATIRSGGRAPDAALLKLTSGSTGPPRGIAVSAAALHADCSRLAERIGLGHDDRLLAAVPLTHSYGFSVLVGPVLLRGATLCFPGTREMLDAAGHLEATFVPSVPAWYRAVLALATPGDLPPSVRVYLSAGAPLAAETARGFRTRLGAPIHVLYGASECGGIAYDPTGTATERGSVGHVLPGVTLELAATETATRGSAATGVVAVRSDAVALRYVPELPDDRVRLDGARYASEDLARVEEGELFLLGRHSDWINVRGKKVNPREVEAVIAALDGVDEVAVLGVAHAVHEEELVRAVVATRVPDVTVPQVLRACATHLAPHKRPRQVQLVPALPRTERGKLDRARLRESPRGPGSGDAP